MTKLSIKSGMALMFFFSSLAFSASSQAQMNHMSDSEILEWTKTAIIEVNTYSPSKNNENLSKKSVLNYQEYLEKNQVIQKAKENNTNLVATVLSQPEVLYSGMLEGKKAIALEMPVVLATDVYDISKFYSKTTFAKTMMVKAVIVENPTHDNKNNLSLYSIYSSDLPNLN